MHFYVTGYKFGMMVLVSLAFSRCVNFVGRGQILVLVLKAVVFVLKGLVLITTLGYTRIPNYSRGKPFDTAEAGKFQQPDGHPDM